jgi:hypothetical protein
VVEETSVYDYRQSANFQAEHPSKHEQPRHAMPFMTIELEYHPKKKELRKRFKLRNVYFRPMVSRQGRNRLTRTRRIFWNCAYIGAVISPQRAEQMASFMA